MPITIPYFQLQLVAGGCCSSLNNVGIDVGWM